MIQFKWLIVLVSENVFTRSYDLNLRGISIKKKNKEKVQRIIQSCFKESNSDFFNLKCYNFGCLYFMCTKLKIK